MSGSVESAVREFARGRLGDGAADLSPDASLLTSGLIDSVGIVELVSFLEGRFGIRIDDEDLVPEHFDSIAAIERFIDAKRSA